MLRAVEIHTTFYRPEGFRFSFHFPALLVTVCPLVICVHILFKVWPIPRFYQHLEELPRAQRPKVSRTWRRLIHHRVGFGL